MVITARVRSTREGNVLTRVCPSINLSVHRGGYPYPIMLCNISQNAMRQQGGTPPGVPRPPGRVPRSGTPPGGYPGQVPPRGYPDPPGGVPRSGTPGGVPGSGTPPGGVPGSGTPPGGVPGSGTPPGGVPG